MARSILIGAAFLCYCGSPAAAQTPACTAIPDAAKISEVGAFSNMRYTQGHAYGYSLMVWRAGDCLFGFFESSQGLAGDTPMGELQNLKYDTKTSHLSFSAKLTTGVLSVKGSNGFEPSRDLFAFDGTLKTRAASGVITYTLQNDPNFTPTHTKVVLRLSNTKEDLMHGPMTRGEWLRQWRPILGRRGPKW